VNEAGYREKLSECPLKNAAGVFVAPASRRQFSGLDIAQECWPDAGATKPAGSDSIRMEREPEM